MRKQLQIGMEISYLHKNFGSCTFVLIHLKLNIFMIKLLCRVKMYTVVGPWKLLYWKFHVTMRNCMHQSTLFI